MKIMMTVLTAVALAASGAAEEFKLWGRITFEEPDLKLSKNREILPMPVIPGNETAKSYLALRVYPQAS